MIPTTLLAARLPRARCLTDALLAPAGAPPAADAIGALGRALADDLAGMAAVAEGGGPVRVDAHLLQSTGSPAFPGADSPFRWSPRTARRSIGVTAVDLCVTGLARAPGHGVGVATARLVEEARLGRSRPGSLAEWVATAGGGELAAVQAEATTWATHLHSAVQWSRLGRVPGIGGRDRWWDCPGAPGIALRGRTDVRVPTPVLVAGDLCEGVSGPPSLLTMVGGRPGPTSRAELGLAALVDALRRPDRPPPARVVGWWPGCGRALVLAVDLPLLRQTAGSVVVAVGAAVRRPPRTALWCASPHAHP